MVIRVQTRDNEPVDKALRRLRKLCNNEGLTRTSKSKAFYEKPSEQRRREARERLKAIRLACRAKENDAQKLLNRRRKARKSSKGGPREGGPGEREGRPSGARAPGRSSGGMRRSPMASAGIGGADSLAG